MFDFNFLILFNGHLIIIMNYFYHIEIDELVSNDII